MHLHPSLPIILVAFVTAGCSWAFQPTASEDVDLQWSVQEPTRTTPEARIFLSNHGLWGYIPEERDGFEPQFTPGEVVELDADDQSHLFAVVETAPWGYRLQRLDDRPLQDELTGALRPVTTADISSSHQSCVLDDPSQLEQRCGASHDHRRWNLYRLDAASPDQSLTVQGDFSDVTSTLGFPVVRRAIGATDGLSTWFEPALEPSDGPWLAIGADAAGAATLQADVIYDESCPVVPDASTLVRTIGIDAAETSLAPGPEHPVAVEQTAVDLGADAIVDCSGDEPRLLTPILTRPLLATDHRYIAPPTYGLEPRPIGDASRQTLSAHSRAAALAAVGDFSAATFWLETSLAELDGDSERFALASMAMVAAAGHPELAMRIGDHLTRRAWNPENDPDYLDGLLVVLETLGDLDGMRTRLEHRDRLVDGRHKHRSGWYRWANVRIELAEQRSDHGPAYESVIDRLQRDGLDGWAVAVWLTLQLEGLELPIVDDPDDLNHRFAEFDAHRLWDRVTGDGADIGCSADGCAPASYGWIDRHDDGDDFISRLETLTPVALTDGFALSRVADRIAVVDDADDKMAFWLAVAPLVPRSELTTAHHQFIRSIDDRLARDRAGMCEDRRRWKSRFLAAAARADEPVLSSQRRRWVEHLRWWADDGLDALCGSPTEFAAAIDDHAGDRPRFTPFLLDLVQRRMVDELSSGAEPNQLVEAARLARRLGDDETCARWNLGLTVGATRAGHLKAAQQHLVEATNCLDGDSPLADTRDFVAAYLEFERGGGRSLSRHGGIERAIDIATGRRVDDDICIGLHPIGFDLDSHLPEPVRRIADHIQVEPTPPGQFTLLTAGTLVDRGRAGYAAGIRDLRRGALTPAARALHRARRDFQHIRHLPALARIQLIDDVIYDGRLAAFADDNADHTDLETDVPELETIRSGDADLVAAAVELPRALADNELPVWTVAMLLERREHQIHQLLDDTERLPVTFCTSDTDADDDFDPGPIIIGDDVADDE